MGKYEDGTGGPVLFWFLIRNNVSEAAYLQLINTAA
jgi:hypothetical protein